MKASAYLPDALVDSDMAHSGEANRTAFNLAMQTDLSYFSWLERPENAYQRKRFGRAMTSMPDAVEGTASESCALRLPDLIIVKALIGNPCRRTPSS